MPYNISIKKWGTPSTWHVANIKCHITSLIFQILVLPSSYLCKRHADFDCLNGSVSLEKKEKLHNLASEVYPDFTYMIDCILMQPLSLPHLSFLSGSFLFPFNHWKFACQISDRSNCLAPFIFSDFNVLTLLSLFISDRFISIEFPVPCTYFLTSLIQPFQGFSTLPGIINFVISRLHFSHKRIRFILQAPNRKVGLAVSNYIKECLAIRKSSMYL